MHERSISSAAQVRLTLGDSVTRDPMCGPFRKKSTHSLLRGSRRGIRWCLFDDQTGDAKFDRVTSEFADVVTTELPLGGGSEIGGCRRHCEIVADRQIEVIAGARGRFCVHAAERFLEMIVASISRAPARPSFSPRLTPHVRNGIDFYADPRHKQACLFS